MDQWRSQVFGANAGNSAIAGDLADPDRDGLANLLEFALGLDPNVGNRGTLPVTSAVEGGYLTLTASKNPLATDVTLSAEVASAPAAWLSGAANVTVLTNTASTFKARDNTLASSTLRRFIRLKASRN
jgi:hypothetical protein